ncbi:MAG TPA: zinc ribbon domain-containing protein [Planctomycetota bacterium]|nr:zinc ribbon domain-containing protein [Planctomycetota bacterium]
MSPGTTNCPNCGAAVPIEHTRCTRCGQSQHRVGSLGDLPTTPGAPLIRPPKRRRISSHDLVPVSLRYENERRRAEQETRQARFLESQGGRVLAAAIAGAALTALPSSIPDFLFLPLKRDAFMLVLLDLVIGAVAGMLVARSGGGIFRGLFFFLLGFAGSIYEKLRMGYPLEHQPVAVAVLASATFLSLLVACVIGLSLDETSDSF